MSQSCDNTDGFAYFESYNSYIWTFYKRLLSIKTKRHGNDISLYKTLVSFAKRKNSNLLEEIDISLISNKNNGGPRTDPWGTPQTTGFFFVPPPFSRPWFQFVLLGIALLDMSRTVWWWHHVIQDDVIYREKHFGQHYQRLFVNQ